MYDSVPILIEEPHVCPYVPAEMCSNLRFVLPTGSPDFMELLLEKGFRHFGADFFRPECAACRRCEGIRVPVAAFRISRSQRRCLSRNPDLSWSVGPVVIDEEHLDLINRFQAARSSARDWDLHWYNEDQYRSSFRWDASVTHELSVRDAAGKLLGVGIIDLAAGSLSGIYNYYEPQQTERGLGTYLILAEIEEARRRGCLHYYLGLWNPDCISLAYKTHYRPYELLRDGVWMRGRETA